ncbi:tetratricopeptide repeat protein [Neobacillus sp. DY30]|uniref:tetratricopeptide repeat protein n=1 Tax=Neobacillus sp. DY30 TaxID=3047871 RepID=UPI0024BF6358|nr:tetratricopeptide repeat protein [Neobacillus sp. DY30]WHX99975.1 tetratricopeptide repeat protein [Neobacillus sp. DY30]
MEAEKQPQEVEGKPAKRKKQPKTFTLIQSILLLVLTLVITSGSGYALGHFYFWNEVDMKRVNEQLEYYKEQVRKDPANLENRIILGYTYYLKGDNEDAIKEFEYVLEQDKNYYDAHYNMGLVFIEEERYNEALLAFDKAVKIAPKDFKGHVQLGITYRYMEKYDEAMKSLETANQLSPASTDIIYQIGLVAEAKKDYKMAIDIYKEALSYDPLFEDAVVALDRIKDKDTETEGE